MKPPKNTAAKTKRQVSYVVIVLHRDHAELNRSRHKQVPDYLRVAGFAPAQGIELLLLLPPMDKKQATNPPVHVRNHRKRDRLVG